MAWPNLNCEDLSVCLRSVVDSAEGDVDLRAMQHDEKVEMLHILFDLKISTVTVGGVAEEVTGVWVKSGKSLYISI